MTIEIPEYLRRAMEAHGVDPEQVAREAATIDLDAPREGDSPAWHGPPVEPEIEPDQAALFAGCPRCIDRGHVYDPELGRDVPCPDCRAERESGRAEAEAGMAQASTAPHVQGWKREAEAWLDALERGTEITADDLIAAVGLPEQEAEQGGNNVVGAMFAAWTKAERLIFVGEFRRSARAVGHGNLLRLWRVA